jgi:hypothetical protein
MASTYSSLKIQLMATGENSGTWGNVTNTNLGTAIEEAIVGSADVSFSSADVTLTLTDTNETQTARNLRLNLTGTSGGARNLIVPAIEKVYIVYNGVADTVTVKNSSGSGIAIPTGKTMWVYNNGTDVVDAVTHLTSLTLTNPLANSQTSAASANGASTIVLRDTSGNFSANTITAALNGNASTASSSGSVTNALTAGTGISFSSGTTYNGSAAITISIPQAVGTTSNVQFGSFGVGTAASGTSGEIRAINNITAYYSSDRTLKENIQEIPNALEIAVAIGSKTFDWTDAYIASKGGEEGYFIQKADFGVVAQDVQAAFPQAVRTRPDGTLAVDYQKLGTLAFGAINQLLKRIEALEAK